jgi:ABC-2 type transport system ATP-binding protein
MLVGLIRPTAGHAVVAGAEPGSPSSLAKVGAMVEAPAFWPFLSGLDNLRLLARYCRVPDSRAREVLEEVELTSRATSAFSTYSMGMKQRLGVAAALLKQPDLLILDEPTNGLDPQGMADFRAMIKRLGQGERTVILSSHLLGEVQQICSRVGVITRGRIAFEGSLEEIRGGPFISVRATPTESARLVLNALVGSDRVDVVDGGVFNRRMIEAGITVIEVKASERSLEDVFMKLTGTEAGL